MRILNEKEVYKKLMKYFLPKCDIISVTKYIDNNIEVTNNTIKIILEETKQTEDELINNYRQPNSEFYIDKLVKNFMYNESIFNKRCKKSYGLTCKLNKYNRQSHIVGSIELLEYNHKIKKWLRKYKNFIIFKKKETRRIRTHDEDYKIEYFLRLNHDLKDEILGKNFFTDWKFPNSMEDLCLYKNGECLLESTCKGDVFIYLINENEYEYLKSIGIEFYEKEFIASSKSK